MSLAHTPSRQRFWIGCLAGLVVFLALNLTAAHLRSDCGLPAWFGVSGCADDLRRAGFPLLAYESGGFIGLRVVHAQAMLFDVFVAIAGSALIGWFWQRRTNFH